MRQIKLEPLEERHGEELFDLFQDERIYRFIPEDPPECIEALTKRYRFLEARKSPDGTEHWLNWVMRREDGVPVGTLQATVEPDGTAFVAYIVFVPFWRQGYAKEGMRQMMEKLLREYQTSAFRALVDTRNEASIRLLESLGFVRTGFRPNADEFKGSSSDEYEFELKSES